MLRERGRWVRQDAYRFIEHASFGARVVFVRDMLDEPAGGANPDLLTTVVFESELSARNAVVLARYSLGTQTQGHDCGDTNERRARAAHTSDVYREGE